MENDNDIRKKEKKIDKNHWMCKIQKYTLGIDATKQYVGYCPFFWMTVLCLFLFPIILIIRAIFAILVGIGKVMDYVLREPVHKKLDQRKEYKKSELRKIPMTPNDYLLKVISINIDHLREKEYNMENIVSYCDNMGEYSWLNCQRIALWFEQNPEWKETHLPDAIKRIDNAREAQRILDEKKRQKEKDWEATKRKLIMKGAFCGKLIFKVAAVAGLGFGCFLIYCGLYKAFTIVHPLFLLQVFSIACIIGAALCLIKVIAGEIDYFVTNSESRCLFYKDYQETELRTIFKPFLIFKFAFNAIGWVFNGIVNSISFIKEAIGMLYKEECPLILWGEETGPIEKRKKETNA